jgi:hypothetical protein
MQIKYFHRSESGVTVFTTDKKEFFVKTPAGGLESFTAPETLLTLAGKPGALEILRHIVAQEEAKKRNNTALSAMPKMSDFGYENGFFPTTSDQDRYNKAAEDWAAQ